LCQNHGGDHIPHIFGGAVLSQEPVQSSSLADAVSQSVLEQDTSLVRINGKLYVNLSVKTQVMDAENQTPSWYWRAKEVFDNETQRATEQALTDVYNSGILPRDAEDRPYVESHVVWSQMQMQLNLDGLTKLRKDLREELGEYFGQYHNEFCPTKQFFDRLLPDLLNSKILQRIEQNNPAGIEVVKHFMKYGGKVATGDKETSSLCDGCFREHALTCFQFIYFYSNDEDRAELDKIYENSIYSNDEDRAELDKIYENSKQPKGCCVIA
jgi:hypothetical protein